MITDRYLYMPETTKSPSLCQRSLYVETHLQHSARQFTNPPYPSPPAHTVSEGYAEVSSQDFLRSFLSMCISPGITETYRVSRREFPPVVRKLFSLSHSQISRHKLLSILRNESFPQSDSRYYQPPGFTEPIFPILQPTFLGIWEWVSKNSRNSLLETLEMSFWAFPFSILFSYCPNYCLLH